MDSNIQIFVDVVIAQRDAGLLSTREAALMISEAISNS